MSKPKTMGKTENTSIRVDLLKQCIAENPLAEKTRYKYVAIRYAIEKLYPELKGIPQSKLQNIIYDIVACDREWRFETQSKNKEEKEIMSQEWQLENGYEADYQNVRCK